MDQKDFLATFGIAIIAGTIPVMIETIVPPFKVYTICLLILFGLLSTVPLLFKKSKLHCYKKFLKARIKDFEIYSKNPRKSRETINYLGDNVFNGFEKACGQSASLEVFDSFHRRRDLIFNKHINDIESALNEIILEDIKVLKTFLHNAPMQRLDQNFECEQFDEIEKNIKKGS